MDATLSTLNVGDEVRAFDPRTLGVVKYGTITAISRKYVTVYFGLSGSVKILGSDVVSVWKSAKSNN
jgi:hypothetical protein